LLLNNLASIDESPFTRRISVHRLLRVYEIEVCGSRALFV